MELKTYNQSGKAGGTTDAADALFGVAMNADLVWQVATSQMSNKRQVLAHAKTRAEVRGGGKKPWKQKGTGRARHGSIRSPIWIGGGAAHGPTKDVNFKKTVTKVAARGALASVLSARVSDGHLLVVDSLELSSGKTKDGVKAIAALTKAFKSFKPAQRVLLVLAGGKDDAPTLRAVANLQNVQAVRAQDLNVLTVLAFPYVIATKEAVAVASKTFTSKK
jgi:large subunit ribosomal protein L4